MTMYNMKEWLRDRGFEVFAEYDKLSRAYRFKITKNDFHMVKYLEYPNDCTPTGVDIAQNNFLTDLVDEFESEYRKHRRNDEASLYSYMMMSEYGWTKTFNRIPQIKDVIFNGPATIVLWSDGTKTVVKAQDGEECDREKGLAMAISKKVLGNKGNYYNTFSKWLKEDEEE